MDVISSKEDSWDLNGGGIVYGFVTTGKYWQMLVYDGILQITEEMTVLFPSMANNRVRWMADYSMLVDCIVVALITIPVANHQLVATSLKLPLPQEHVMQLKLW